MYGILITTSYIEMLLQFRESRNQCDAGSGQDSQDGCPLVSACPPLDQHLLHLHPTHLTDLPAHLPQAQLVTVLTKGAVRGVPARLLVSLAT